jgi:hypothetical protein
MERNELKELRPIISGISTECLNSNEQFQNEVLRPIIKFQHELIIALVRSNAQFLNLIAKKGTRIEYLEKIKIFIGKQPEIKYRLLGAVVGMMTGEELSYYLSNQTELNKRTNQMICQRIADTLY